MPRLIGKQPNSNLYAGLFLLLTIGAVGSLEYYGVIDLIPGSTRNEYKPNSQSQLPVIDQR